MTNPIPKDWKQVKSSEIIDVRDGTHDSPKKVESGGIPLLTSKNIVNGELSFHSYYCISDDDAVQVNKRSKVEKGDILVSMIGTVGESALIKEEPNFVIKNVGLFRNNREKILPEFLIKQLHSQRLKGLIKSFLNGGIQKFIGLGDLRKLPILLPPLPEQNRVVAVLETWDKAIEAFSQKIELKKKVKKGLMQQLLTGKKRLPGFSGDWHTVKLGDVCEIKTGKKDNKDKVEDGEFPFFVRSPNIEKINSYSFDGEAILIPGEGNIGKIFHYINGRFDYHQRVYKVSDFKNNIVGKFVYFHFVENFGKEAKMHSVKATVDSLRLPTFQMYEIKTPSKEEQTAIAQILTTADDEITALEYKKQKLEDQKKYLLNNLITGQIRTPENLTMPQL